MNDKATIYDVAAIVSSDHMAAVIAATPLRRAGIAVETFCSGSRKSQWAKAARFEVLIDLDEQTVRDMVLGGKIAISGDIVAATLEAFDGIECRR